MIVESDNLDPTTADAEERRLLICRRLLAERQIILRYLRDQNWNHASWIMLLELYAADAAGKFLSVSSLGQAASVSVTTAVRLAASLEARTLAARTVDPYDGRRTHVTLATRGRATLHCLLDDCAKLRAG